MKLWITGSKGLVGRALQKLCGDERIDFIATGREEVDIGSLRHVKEFLHTQGKKVTHIVNCAAFTQVDDAEKQFDAAHRTNALGPEHLGTVAHTHGLHLLHLSTDYVFGPEGSRPFTETDLCNPINTYAKTKYEGENRLLEVFPQACILRTSWVFGRGGKNFVSSLLEKIRTQEKIDVVSDQRSRLTYAHDLAQTILALLCHCGIFHFANHGEISRFDVAQKILQIASQKPGISIACQKISPVSHTSFPLPAPRPLYSALDTTKIQTLLGIAPRPWEEAIHEFIHEV